MSWEAVGAIGDAVGGLGVIVSLVYLAVQTRHNTKALQAASYHQTNESYANISMSIALDPSLATTMDRAIVGEALSRQEKGRVGWVFLSLFRRAESMYFQSELGTLQAESWAGVRSTLQVCMEIPAGREWWEANRGRFNPRFRAYVESDLIRGAEGDA